MGVIPWKEHPTLSRTVNNTEVRVATLDTSNVKQLQDGLFARFKPEGGGSREKWAGCTFKECHRMAVEGDTAQLSAARGLATKVDKAIPSLGMEYSLAPTVAGGAVCVPAALAGHPMAFRRMQVAPAKSTTPIRVFINLGAACHVSAENIAARGRAIVALAWALSRRRPVQLEGFFGCQPYYGSPTVTVIRIPVDLRFMHWPGAAYVLGHPGFFRHVLIRAYSDMGGDHDDTGPGAMHHAYRGKERELLGAGEGDVVFGDDLFDNSDIMNGNPIKWIEEQFKKHVR